MKKCNLINEAATFRQLTINCMELAGRGLRPFLTLSGKSLVTALRL